jgi:hypothetical protein
MRYTDIEIKKLEILRGRLERMIFVRHGMGDQVNISKKQHCIVERALKALYKLRLKKSFHKNYVEDVFACSQAAWELVRELDATRVYGGRDFDPTSDGEIKLYRAA